MSEVPEKSGSKDASDSNPRDWAPRPERSSGGLRALAQQFTHRDHTHGRLLISILVLALPAMLASSGMAPVQLFDLRVELGLRLLEQFVERREAALERPLSSTTDDARAAAALRADADAALAAAERARSRLEAQAALDRDAAAAAARDALDSLRDGEARKLRDLAEAAGGAARQARQEAQGRAAEADAARAEARAASQREAAAEDRASEAAVRASEAAREAQAAKRALTAAQEDARRAEELRNESSASTDESLNK